MIRRPQRSTRTETLFPYRRASDLIAIGIDEKCPFLPGSAQRHMRRDQVGNTEMVENAVAGGKFNASLPFRFRKLFGSIRHMVFHCSTHLRSDEHTSELHSLMRTSYAFFCLINKINLIPHTY